jgi:hypothetical protein
MRAKAYWPGLLHKARQLIVPLTIIAIVTALALTPFLWLYLPKSIETAQSQTASWTPAFMDIINVGNQNWMFGWLIQALDTTFRPDYLTQAHLEFMTGITPVFFILFMCASWGLWRTQKSSRDIVYPMLVLTILVSWILTAHIIGFTHKRWSLWKFAHLIIPGAAGIRSISRYQIFLTFPVILVVIHWLSRIKRRAGHIVMPVLCCVLLAEQWNLSPPVYLDRTREMERLQTLPVPPATCQAFYVTKAREGDAPMSDNEKLYSPNVDAMLIAEIVHVPTLNGYSSYTPPDWDFSDFTAPDYQARVTNYATKHNLQGLCGLDLNKLQWSVAS